MTGVDRVGEFAQAVAAVRTLKWAPASFEQLVVVAAGAPGVVTGALGDLGLRVPALRAGVELAPFVGERTLVLALGRALEPPDEELLEDARRHGAAVVRVGDGFVSEATAPSVALDSGAGGIGLSSMLGAVVALAERAGLLAVSEGSFAAAAAQLERRASSRVAEELGRGIGRTFPIVWGAAGLGAAAAEAWAAEVALRTKAPAFAASLPQATYVDVAAFGLSGDVTRQLVTLVRLEVPGEPEALQARIAAALEAVRETVADIITVRAEGEGRLAHLVDLMLLGEQVARSLAYGEGVDPDSVAVLEDLARTLGGDAHTR